VVVDWPVIGLVVVVVVVECDELDDWAKAAPPVTAIRAAAATADRNLPRMVLSSCGGNTRLKTSTSSARFRRATAPSRDACGAYAAAAAFALAR
jgi:hypothetical protein